MCDYAGRRNRAREGLGLSARCSRGTESEATGPRRWVRWCPGCGGSTADVTDGAAAGPVAVSAAAMTRDWTRTGPEGARRRPRGVRELGGGDRRGLRPLRHAGTTAGVWIALVTACRWRIVRACRSPQTRAATRTTCELLHESAGPRTRVPLMSQRGPLNNLRMETMMRVCSRQRWLGGTGRSCPNRQVL